MRGDRAAENVGSISDVADAAAGADPNNAAADTGGADADADADADA